MLLLPLMDEGIMKHKVLLVLLGIFVFSCNSMSKHDLEKEINESFYYLYDNNAPMSVSIADYDPSKNKVDVMLEPSDNLVDPKAVNNIKTTIDSILLKKGIDDINYSINSPAGMIYDDSKITESFLEKSQNKKESGKGNVVVDEKKVHYINHIKTNIRKHPTLSAKIVSKLNTGETVEVIGKSDKKQTIAASTNYWYNIKWGDKEGWVFGKYLSEGTPEKISELIKSETENYENTDHFESGDINVPHSIFIPNKKKKDSPYMKLNQLYNDRNNHKTYVEDNTENEEMPEFIFKDSKDIVEKINHSEKKKKRRSKKIDDIVEDDEEVLLELSANNQLAARDDDEVLIPEKILTEGNNKPLTEDDLFVKQENKYFDYDEAVPSKEKMDELYDEKVDFLDEIIRSDNPDISSLKQSKLPITLTGYSLDNNDSTYEESVGIPKMFSGYADVSKLDDKLNEIQNDVTIVFPDVKLVSGNGYEMTIDRILQDKLVDKDLNILKAVAKILQGKVSALYKYGKVYPLFTKNKSYYHFHIKDLDVQNNRLIVEIRKVSSDNPSKIKDNRVCEIPLDGSKSPYVSSTLRNINFFQNFGETSYAEALYAIDNAGYYNKNKIIMICDSILNCVKQFNQIEKRLSF